MSVYNRRREREVPPEIVNIKTGTLITRIHPNPTIYDKKEIIIPASSYGIREVTWDSKRLGPPYLTGGDFATIKVGVDHNSVKGHGTYTTNPSYRYEGSPWYEYVGGFLPPNLVDLFGTASNYASLNVDHPDDTGFMNPRMAELGDQAYSLMSPHLSKADASVFLGESRDLPRMLSGTSHGFHDAWQLIGGNAVFPLGKKALRANLIMSPKKAADHFINHQFGWVPFLNDTAKFIDVVANSKKYIDEMIRQNDTWVKRVRRLTGSNSSALVSSYNVPSAGPWGDIYKGMCEPKDIPGGYPAYGITERFVESQEINYASGSVKYYRPEFDGSRQDVLGQDFKVLQQAMTLAGARINPSIIWRITPWSWAIDWFANVGGVIDRAQSFANDGIVWQYLFLMSHIINNIRLSTTIYFHDGQKTLDWQVYNSCKSREAAGSPFEFTLTGPLSARQIAIMAALGLSRRRP